METQESGERIYASFFFFVKAAAVRAYHEWMPTRESGERIYRAFHFGDLASLYMLENRLVNRSSGELRPFPFDYCNSVWENVGGTWSVLECVGVCWSVLECVRACWSVLRCWSVIDYESVVRLAGSLFL
jgi:hypothetical protein